MSVDGLIGQLSSVDRDHLLAILAEQGARDSRSKIESLDREIDEIKRRLNAMHAERESFKSRAQAVERILGRLSEKARPEDLELAALRLWLTSVGNELQGRMAQIRPEAELQKKRELTELRDLVVCRQDFATQLLRRMKEG